MRRIPFPLAMDELIPDTGDPTREQASGTGSSAG